MRALLNKQREFFKKKPPYAVFQLDEVKQTLKGARKEDQVIVWNDTAEFVFNSEKFLFVRFFHQDLFSDNYIGEAIVPLALLGGGAEAPKIYPIVYNGRNKGSVELSYCLGRHLVTPKKVPSEAISR